MKLLRDELSRMDSARVAEDAKLKVLRGTSSKIARDCKRLWWDCDGIEGEWWFGCGIWMETEVNTEGNSLK
jgi:hypothetical protein